MKHLKLLVASLAIAVGSSAAFAGAVVSGFTTNSLGPNDDGSTGNLALGFSVNFFGNTYSSLWANNNGNLTFTGPMGTYTPFNLYTTGVPLIAPFFADVDTRGAGSGLLQYNQGTYLGHQTFGATWTNVGYYSFGTNKKNTFQTLLVNRTDTGAGNFDIYFNYDQIQWETGGASGGSNGLGGFSARAGYSNGTAGNSYELPGSGVNGAFLDTNGTTGLIHNSNVGVNGRYLFTVRNGNVTPAQAPDATSTLGLLGLVLAALGFAKRKLA